MSSPQQARQDRQIRVFISSTFKDMKEERDHLVKFTFPQLRKLCESRGVVWGEVDLRWGVPDEAVAEGKVLPICLEEIKRCRPYFIGLLGERYGWIPDAIPPEIVEREPWLAEHVRGRKSVTELEILHGVLNNPDMAEHAFFYFRDPAYVDSLPADRKKDVATESTEDTEKLRSLKDRIRRSGFPVRENYPDPKALDNLVLADLTAVIDERFPEGSQPDPLDREAMDHEAYAQSRERVYIGRAEYFAKLDAHAAGGGDQPLVILGESGGGKSALLANWLKHYREAHPDVLILQHYIGATPYSADWAAMLRRLMGEFKRHLGIQQDIPDKPDALRSAFPNWLHMAAAKGRIVLVLDALNQLEDRDGAPDLVWLPPVMPENVRLIVSTLPGRPLDEIKKRAWPSVDIEPLSQSEREKLIVEYLAQYAKALSPTRVQRIAAAPQSANPLYLRVLLDELRVFGEYELLEARIDHYLQAKSPRDLYRKVIARWEQDYARGTTLVSDTLRLLWSARRGLSETELLQTLGIDGEPLPRATWSPLYLAMSDGLVTRGGLLIFAHDFLRTAVRDACLPTNQQQEEAHLRLADYFQRQSASARRTDELPWQLAQARAWESLQSLLIDRAFFTEAWGRNQFDVRIYWTQIEAGSPLRMVQAYRTLIENPDSESDKGFLHRLGMLLADTGHPAEALRLPSALIEHFRATGDMNSLQMVLTSQANILYARGDLDDAMALYKDEERICRQLGNLHGLQRTLGSQAVILHVRGDLDGAMALYKEEERICRQLGRLDYLSTSLSNQAVILYDRGDLDGAMVRHKEEERVCRQLSHLDGLSKSLAGQAVVLYAQGDLDGAMALFKEQERICRQLSHLDGLSKSLGGQVGVLYARGDLDGAMALSKEEERICRQLGNPEGLARSLGNRALTLQQMGRTREGLPLAEEAYKIASSHGYATRVSQIEPILDGLRLAVTGSAGAQPIPVHEAQSSTALLQEVSTEANRLWLSGDIEGALMVLRKREQICREIGNEKELFGTLHDQAAALLHKRQLDEAMALLEQAKAGFQSLNYTIGIAHCVANLATVALLRGQMNSASSLYKEAERLCREAGDDETLAGVLCGGASALLSMGETSSALTLFEQAEPLCRKFDDKVNLQVCLGNHAAILHGRGESEKAMVLWEEQERLCRELGNDDGLQRSLANEASILYARADLDGAMARYKEAETICRRLNKPDCLQAILGGQALILQAREDLEGAMALHKEEEQICRQTSNLDGLQRSLGNQAGIAYARRNLDGALALYKEQEKTCRQLGNLDGLQGTLGNQALILKARGDLDGAMALLKEQERICRQLGNLDGLQGTLGNQALILKARGDLDGAMALLKEQERICRQLGNLEGLAISLINQALTLQKMGRAREGLPLAEEAFKTATSHGYASLAKQIEPILNAVRQAARKD